MQLCARFAYRPNALQYCGSSSATEKLLKCIRQGDCVGVENEITKFKALHSYLQLISQKAELPLLHYKVCEAYWIGNELLERFNSRDFMNLLRSFKNQNVPDFFINELQEKFKKSSMRFVPHHSFNVLFVGVGQVTASVRYSLKNINNCLIRWGTVRNCSERVIEIDTMYLKKEREVIRKVHRIESIPSNDSFVQKPRHGATVALHWGTICRTLTKVQEKQLDHYTDLLLRECTGSFEIP